MYIHERIKERRKELNLRAEDVADMLGISKATLYRYESAYIEKVPSSVLEKIAEVLKTTPAYLMGWDEEKEADKFYYRNEKHDAVVEAIEKLNIDDLDRVMDLINRLNK